MDFPRGTYTGPNPDQRLPNGHIRQEYYEIGFSDMDIDFWGLDKHGAPSPQVASFVFLDMMAEEDGDGDGELDF